MQTESIQTLTGHGRARSDAAACGRPQSSCRLTVTLRPWKRVSKCCGCYTCMIGPAQRWEGVHEAREHFSNGGTALEWLDRFERKTPHDLIHCALWAHGACPLAPTDSPQREHGAVARTELEGLESREPGKSGFTSPARVLGFNFYLAWGWTGGRGAHNGTRQGHLGPWLWRRRNRENGLCGTRLSPWALQVKR